MVLQKGVQVFFVSSVKKKVRRIQSVTHAEKLSWPFVLLPMLKDIFIAFFVSLLIGIVMTIFEKTLIRLHRKYRFPWHIQRGTRKRKTDKYGTIIWDSEYTAWECVDDCGHDLESAIRDLAMRREIFGGELYRLRNWRTREIIPGEVLVDENEWWVVELRYGTKSWHTFQDAHAARDYSHTLDYCLKFVKKQRETFARGIQSGIHYRLHNHEGAGEIIPLEALGV